MASPHEKPPGGGKGAPTGRPTSAPSLQIDTSRLRLKDGEKLTLGTSGLSLDTRGLSGSSSGMSIGASRISFNSSGLSLGSWQSLLGSSNLKSAGTAGATATRAAPQKGKGRSTATTDRRREVIQSSPILVVVREHNLDAHNDPSRRGGYLRIEPGMTPEIVLDGIASEAEQLDAEQRCRRELAMWRRSQEEFDESRDGPNQPLPGSDHRRELVRLTDNLVVSRDYSKEAHADAERRGAYVLLRPQRRPEIVLDGLCSRTEQQAALERCLHFLELTQDSGGSLKKLMEMLQGSRPVYSGGARLSESQHQFVGQRLLQQGLVTVEDLEDALAQQAALSEGTPVRRLVSLLVEARRLTLNQAARVLAEQRGLRGTASPVLRVDAPLRHLLPLPLLIEVEAAPLFLTGRTLGVALCDPHEEGRVALLQSRTEYLIQPLQAAQCQVHKLLLSMTPKR